MRSRWLASTGLAAVVLVVAACGSTSSNGSGGGSGGTPSSSAGGGSSGAVVNARSINGTMVLTNAQGHTVYWFAPDTSTTSKCSGTCAKYWPPVKGPATAGAGVTGKLGTITRSDGTVQATYKGHPLYTYVVDTAPGQAKGNGLNLSGGKWYEMTVSGAMPAPKKTKSGGGGGGGGYGY